jgi:hypothetical protein
MLIPIFVFKNTDKVCKDILTMVTTIFGMWCHVHLRADPDDGVSTFLWNVDNDLPN